MRQITSDPLSRIQLAKTTSDFCIDGVSIFLEPIFLGILRGQRIMDDFVNRMERTALKPLLNELFVFGFKFYLHGFVFG